MKRVMRALIGLQNCDTRIREILGKKAEGPRKIKDLQEELNAAEDQAQEALHELEKLKIERRAIEQEIDALESKTEKSNIKLSNIKSNKEYRAVLKEIDDLKGGKLTLEDKVLELMEEIETREERYAVGRLENERLKKQFEQDRDNMAREIKALDKILEGLEKERLRFTGAIDADLLKRYSNLKEHKGGMALSQVIKGVCQTCHMSIPPQKFNELIRGEELMSCPNCSRIIYWGEERRLQGHKAD